MFLDLKQWTGRWLRVMDEASLSLPGIQMRLLLPDWCEVSVGIKVSGDTCKECINLRPVFFRERHHQSGWCALQQTRQNSVAVFRTGYQCRCVNSGHHQSGVLCSRHVKIALQCFVQVISVGVWILAVCRFGFLPQQIHYRVLSVQYCHSCHVHCLNCRFLFHCQQ